MTILTLKAQQLEGAKQKWKRTVKNFYSNKNNKIIEIQNNN